MGGSPPRGSSDAGRNPVSSNSSRAAQVAGSSPSTSRSPAGISTIGRPGAGAELADQTATSPVRRDREHRRGVLGPEHLPGRRCPATPPRRRGPSGPRNRRVDRVGLAHALSRRRSGARPDRSAARAVAAPTNSRNNGCGRVGRDRSSGWNWPAMKNGWSGSSMISARRPFCELPLIVIPCSRRTSR